MRNYDNVVTLSNGQTRRHNRILKLKAGIRRACQIIGTMGGILAVGTVGALDTESITLVQAMVQGGIGSAVVIGCYLTYNKVR